MVQASMGPCFCCFTVVLGVMTDPAGRFAALGRHVIVDASAILKQLPTACVAYISYTQKARQWGRLLFWRRALIAF